MSVMDRLEVCCGFGFRLLCLVVCFGNWLGLGFGYYTLLHFVCYEVACLDRLRFVCYCLIVLGVLICLLIVCVLLGCLVWCSI